MKRSLSVLALLCVLLAGCGGGDAPSQPATTVSGPSASPAAGSGTLVLRTALAQARLEKYRFQGFDQTGALSFGPAVVPVTPEVVIPGISPSTVTMNVDVLSSTGSVQRAYVQPVDFSSGTVVIADPAFVDRADPVVRRFASLGCNRLNYGDRKLTPSSANVVQLQRDFVELPAFAPRPEFLFYTGDIVMAEDVGTKTLIDQLTAWNEMYLTTALPGSGVQLVAMTGNHEMLTFDPAINSEIPNPPTGAAWVQQMKQFIPAADGPTQAAPNPDGVKRDESQLSFSFRSGDICFICLNTETWEGGLTPEDTGKVPLNWLSDKLATANADATVKHIFVFGHKPVWTPAPDVDLPTINPAQIQSFYNLLASTKKVRAYICAHAHLWNQQVPGNAPPGSTLQQVIAGMGGSDLTPPFLPPLAWFGYAVVDITASGHVVVESWGRPVPDPYKLQVEQPASTLRSLSTIY